MPSNHCFLRIDYDGDRVEVHSLDIVEADK